MKNIALLLLLFTGIVNGQIVNIPDANFKQYLISTNCVDLDNNSTFDTDVDSNNDGEIQLSEALAVTSILLQDGTINSVFVEINNVTGIQSFTNLSKLMVRSTSLATINISALTQLTDLIINNTQISTVNLATLTNLTSLYIGFNPLITSLDISTLVNLRYFGCISNNLNALDVSNNHLLYDVNCSENHITSLDVSNLNELQVLQCYNNLLTILDVSNNPYLSTLNFDNNPNLTYLNLKNGGNLVFPSFSSCPNLSYVCEDDDDVSSTILNLNNNIPGNTIQVSSYCSFTPGGNYNTITGTVLYDILGDGCDTNDIANPYFKVKINDGTNTGSTFTNAIGNYTFYTQTGNFTLTPILENPSYFNFSPPNALINFPLLNNTIQVQNFCITANGLHPDLEIILVPINNARPGFDALYKLIYKNKGNQTESGSINLTFDDAKSDFINASPSVDNQAINSLLWNYSNLQPFETREINFTLNTNSSQEIPPVNDGDILNFTSSINYAEGDETPLDNIFELHQPVVNAIDPNDKTCLEGSIISPNEIGKYVHYNINFENIGTEAATNIVVKDTIDVAKFDINSIQLLYASHPVETKINGNIVEFIFQNIELPPSNINPIGGHGNVLFKIKTLPTLVVGDEIANTANIYFDYNAPIATNTARTNIANLGYNDFTKDKSISIYPNPTKNSIHIQAKNNIQSIQLFDVQGRILQQVLDNKNATTLDISHQANGVYFVKITTDKGSSTEKIMKE